MDVARVGIGKASKRSGNTKYLRLKRAIALSGRVGGLTEPLLKYIDA
jgi:hypothetical protein